MNNFFLFNRKNDVGDIFMKNSHKKILIKPITTSKNEIDQYKLKMKQMKKGLDSLNKITNSDEKKKKNFAAMNRMSKLTRYNKILFYL